MLTRSALGYLLAAAVFLVALIDGGSVLLTKMAVPDDTTAAGQAAAEIADGVPPTQEVAVQSFRAAEEFGSRRGLTLSREGFTLYPDGRVRLTASRTAPTLVLHRIPQLRDLAVVTRTTTVTALPYS